MLLLLKLTFGTTALEIKPKEGLPWSCRATLLSVETEVEMVSDEQICMRWKSAQAMSGEGRGWFCFACQPVPRAKH